MSRRISYLLMMIQERLKIKEISVVDIKPGNCIAFLVSISKETIYLLFNLFGIKEVIHFLFDPIYY